MSFAARTKDDPGDVGRAADQQQSVDNDNHLFAAVDGPIAPPPGRIHQWIEKSGIADNVATEIATITLDSDLDSDAGGGVYGVELMGIATHGVGPALETSVIHIRAQFARAINDDGSAGNSSAVVESSETAVAASTAGTKTISTVTFTLSETSEYVLSVRITIDLAGSTVTTGTFAGMMTLDYAGFTSAPFIASAE
jgi:hypothetical protein